MHTCGPFFAWHDVKFTNNYHPRGSVYAIGVHICLCTSVKHGILGHMSHASQTFFKSTSAILQEEGSFKLVH
eukprot:1161235-Pelagomonas_calceolata.AAC.5